MRVLPSGGWQAMALIPPLEKRAGLERRKDKTITETSTLIQTLTINQTFTEHVMTTVISSVLVTITQSATVNHKLTVPVTTTIQASPSVSPATVARIAPALAPLESSSSSVQDRPLQTSPATTAASPLPVATTPKKDSLGSTVILGIVLGSLAFLGLLLAGAIFWRRMMKKYRQQRVMRKQAQTEGNDMPRYIISEPVGRIGTGRPLGHAGFQQQNVAGSDATDFYRSQASECNVGFQPRQVTGTTPAEPGSQQHAAGSKAAEAEEWEECPLDDGPPAYRY